MSFFSRLSKKFKKYRYGEGYHLMKYRNLNMMLRAGNYVDRAVMAGGEYESEQLDKLVQLILENDVNYFVDVGANIGIYSLVVAKECDRLEKVFSIEAQVENYNQLCANIHLNNFDRVICAKNIGASDKKGMLEFLVNKGSSTGTSRISETSPKSTEMRKFNVDYLSVDTLDNILGEVKNKVLFFKIDVEGHEYNVLKGMSKILKNNICFFQIEILDNDFSAITDDFNFEEIGRIGFDYYFKSKGGAE